MQWARHKARSRWSFWTRTAANCRVSAIYAMVASCVCRARAPRLYPCPLSVLAAGGVGEVCIRGPNVTAGYRNNPDANEKEFRGEQKRGFEKPGALAGRLHALPAS